MIKVSKPSGKLLFGEIQQFRQTWIWVLLISSAAIPLIIAVVLAFTAQKGAAINGAIAFLMVLGIQALHTWFFYFTRLETVITDEGVFYRWWPFYKKYSSIPVNDVADVTIRNYPQLQYGAVRKKGYGKVHVVDKGQGVQLILKDKQKIYLGSKRIPALEHALGRLREKASKEISLFVNPS